MQRNLDRDLNAPDAQREKVLAAVERPGSLETIQDLIEMCANNIEFAVAMAIPKVEGHPELKCLFSECSLKLYKLFKSSNFLGWYMAMLKRQTHFYSIGFTKLDSSFCQLSSLVQHNKTIERIKARKAHLLIDDDRLHQAFRVIWLFIQEVKDKMSMQSIFRDVPLICPDSHNPDIQASKMQKTSETDSGNPTARGNGEGGPNTPRQKQRNKGRKSEGSNGGGLVGETPKKDPKVQGFFLPLQGCTYKQMFGPILEKDPKAKMPCFHHHGLTLACTKDGCPFLHGGFPAFPKTTQVAILNGMMVHKTATLNPELRNNRRFKACVDEKYNELWDEPASPNDGA